MPLRSGAWAKSRTGCPTDNQGRSDEADLSIGQRARPHFGVVAVISERRHQVVAIAVAGWEPRSADCISLRPNRLVRQVAARSLHDGDVRFGL